MRSKANEQKLLEKSRLDEAIFDALELGISNVSHTTRETILKAAEDGKLSQVDKRELCREAKHIAKEVLLTKGIDLYKAASADALDAIVRRLVDAGQECKKE